jgi:hypothetical protein
MVAPRNMTLEERAANAAARWATGVARQTRGRLTVDRSRWLLASSRAVLDRSRPPIHGGQDPAASPASIRTRLLGLIDRGPLPAVMPRRMFIGPCRETHPCTVCGTDIGTGAQEFEWTNPGNLIVFFHRRCADIYLTLNDGHGGG